MFQNIGFPGLILILLIALIIFGPKKLPELGRAVGQTLREFKKTANEITQDVLQSTEQQEEKGPSEEKSKTINNI